MFLLLFACDPVPPPVTQRTSAAAVAGNRAIFDRVVEQPTDGKVRIVVERCLVHDAAVRCSPREAGPTFLSRVGGHMLEERRTRGEGMLAPERRDLAVLDSMTGEPMWSVFAGFRPPDQVLGGDVLAHPDGGLVIIANHGLFGADTWLAAGPSTPRSVQIGELDPAGTAVVGELLGVDHVAVASASGGQVVEAWPALEGERPLWRQGLPGWPDASWVHGRRVGVHAGRWQVFDLDSGVLVADVPGTRGACVIGGRMYTHLGSTLTSVDLASGTVETASLVLPDVAHGCRVHEGAPVFHGLGANADGWLQGPAFPLLDVPGWELELAVSIGEGPVPWWIAVPYEHVGVVDPVARSVAIEEGVGTTVSSGAHRFWTRLDPANRRQTLVSGEAQRQLVARTVPTADHVDQGVVWTFPNYARGDADLVQRFRLPTLDPVE